MAKKRKEKTEEEELDFKLPKFDEEKFLKRERRNIKTTFFSFLFGFLIAIISFGFWSLLSGNDLRWELVLLFCVFNASWLKYLFVRLNLDLTDFGRKGWFTSYAIYFFTWLLVLLVLVNPPFYDDESPLVEVVALPSMQELGGTVKIIARIVDNVGVEKQNIDFNLIYPDETSHSPEFNFEDSIFSYTYENIGNLMGTYEFTLLATDINGHNTSEIVGTFVYDNDTIKLASPAGAGVAPGPAVTYADSIRFDVGADVSRMYYKVNDRVEINATFDGDYYETSPEMDGWLRGENATVKAYVDIVYYFVNLNEQFNNTIVDTSTYYFGVSDDSKVGTEVSPEIAIPGPGLYMVPGFELLVFIISLVVVVLIFKYRKKDRRN